MVIPAWMPITKEMFVKVLNMIKEQQEIDDKVGDALETVCGGWVLFNSENKNHQALVMLLEELCVDIHGYISWWLYESCNKIVKEMYTNPDKEPRIWDLTTPEALYDYIDEFRMDWINEKAIKETKKNGSNKEADS